MLAMPEVNQGPRSGTAPVCAFSGGKLAGIKDTLAEIGDKGLASQ